MTKTFIIAEAGVNHMGSVGIAMKMVDAAAAAGADAVKFQTFDALELVTYNAPKAGYQLSVTDAFESQLDMLKKLELSPDDHKQLIAYAGEKGIMFLSTPFDLKSIALLDSLGLGIMKIASGEITNLTFLRAVGGLGKQIIMSTGMADLKEVQDALSVLTGAGTKKDDITVLHCNTEYPSPMEDVNLRAMLTIRDALGVRVGYSDHTLGIEVPVAAVALGAEVIEKHFTLDRHMPGPDHKASLEPTELKSMVDAIRNIEKALGDGVKRPSPSEMKNRLAARKSIVAARDIRAGETFTALNITSKRPGTAMSPMLWDTVVGQKAKRDFMRDEAIAL